MEIIKSKVAKDYNLLLFSDIHYGTKLYSAAALGELIETLSKPGTYGICGGDWIDAITTDDKRYDDVSMGLKPSEQRDHVIKFFTPVRNKLLGGLMGNHELKLHRVGDMAKEICHGLDIPYGTYSSIFEMYDKNGLQFKLFYTHGRHLFTSNAKDPEQKEANMKAALKMTLKMKFADCLVMAHAHCHKLLVVPPSRELYLTAETVEGRKKIVQHYMETGDVNPTYIPPDNRYYCATGSFLRLFRMGASGYGEVFGYDPIPLGWVEMRVRDGKVFDVTKREVN